MAKKEITGDFNWRIQEVPSFLEGNDTEIIYNSLDENVKRNIGYDEKTKTVLGSTPFLAARVDSMLRHLGIRAATPADLGRKEIIEGIRREHYTDASALILRSMDDSYEENIFLIKRIAEEVEKRNEKLELPVMITGFDVKPSNDKGYGLDITAREDFKAIHDDRLEGKFNGQRFSEVDKIGLPIFNKKGKRTWVTRENGLSRLSLGGDLDLGSIDGRLALSDDAGRVVLFSGGATSQIFLSNYNAGIEAGYKSREIKLLKAKEDLERLYREVGKLLGDK